MNSYTDWQPYLQNIIVEHKPKVLLEFGLGVGSELFTQLVDKVYSVELLAYPEHEEWFKKTEDEFIEKGITNWKAYVYKTEDEYTPKLKNYINLTVGRIKPDMVFVDPGVHCRGDIVNQMMDRKVKIIAAHDTSQGFSVDENDIYGWGKINPVDYEIMGQPEGQGTTVWIRKEE